MTCANRSFKIFLTCLLVLLSNFVIFTFVSKVHSKFKEIQYQKEFFFNLTISNRRRLPKHLGINFCLKWKDLTVSQVMQCWWKKPRYWQCLCISPIISHPCSQKYAPYFLSNCDFQPLQFHWLLCFIQMVISPTLCCSLVSERDRVLWVLHSNIISFAF